MRKKKNRTLFLVHEVRRALLWRLLYSKSNCDEEPH